MSCGSNQFGDDGVVDFASAQQGMVMQQRPVAVHGGYEGDYEYGDNPDQISEVVGTPVGAAYSSGPVYDYVEDPRPQAVKNSYEGHSVVYDEPVYDDEDYDGEDFIAEEAGPKNFLVPFELSVRPNDMEGDYAQWKLSDVYYEKFAIPGNKEFGDESILAGIDVYNVSSDFPTDIALQVSMKSPGIPESDRSNPDSASGERLFGPMGLGSHKKMTVHAKISPGDKQDFCVMAGTERYQKSFLEEINAQALKRGKQTWTESSLRDNGLFSGKRGNFMVERDHPVVKYISAIMGAELEEAGADHYSVSKKTFNHAVKRIMNEAAVNIKLGDARQNLRIFAMRLVPSKGKMEESTWKDDRGLFDKITASAGKAQEDAKKRILEKTYTITGNLCLNYIPIVEMD